MLIRNLEKCDEIQYGCDKYCLTGENLIMLVHVTIGLLPVR